MSVRVVDRKPSSIQILDDAKKICDDICQRMTNFCHKLNNSFKSCWKQAKSVYSYLLETPIKESQQAWENLTIGYKIWISNKKTLMEKNNYYKKACNNYEKVLKCFSSLQKCFYKNNLIKQHSVIVVGQMLTKQIQNIYNEIIKNKTKEKNFL